MKAYELLKVNRNLLMMIQDAKLSIEDLKYLDMYKEYTQLCEEGHKKTYIMQYLSDEYNIAERTAYRIVERFSADILI